MVLGHINFANAPIKKWIYAFHMPLFFFASGLTLHEDNLRTFIIKKIKKIYLPYLFWGFIFSNFAIKSIPLLLYGSNYSISQASSLSSLWFLPTLFIAEIIVQVLFKITKNNKLLMLLAGLLLTISFILPEKVNGYYMNFDVSLIAVFFIVLGKVCHTYLDTIKNTKTMIITLIISFALSLLYLLNPINKDSYILLSVKQIGNPILFVMTAICSIVFVCSLSILLDKYLIKNNYLMSLGQCTLPIFLFNKYVIKIFKYIFQRIAFNLYIELTITTIGTLIICFKFGKFIYKHFPILFGNYSNN